MQNLARLAFTFGLVATLAAGAATAQPAPADDALGEIAAALTRIAQAMEKQLEGGRLDLLIRRVESGQRRLDQVDEQLRRAENYRDGQIQERTRLEMQITNFDDPARAEAMGFDPGMVELQLENLEFERELVNRQLAELDARIGRLQEERTRRRREVEDWQAFIDRELAGMQ